MPYVTFANVEGFNEAVADARPTVAMWGADHCPFCKATKPALKAFSKSYPGIIIGTVDSDSVEMAELQNKYKIKGLPTLIVFFDQHEVSRVVGQQSADDLEDFVDEALSR